MEMNKYEGYTWANVINKQMDGPGQNTMEMKY